MYYRGHIVIDALFGSKTRVKLLHLFLNNPGKSFYVREITRLIDEQINSVRRELANMVTVGIVTSDTADNKLYYTVEQRYAHYVPLRAIFADEAMESNRSLKSAGTWEDVLQDMPGLILAVAAGVFVKGSVSSIDLLLVGTMASATVKKTIKEIEKRAGRELNYSVLTHDEFYYRLSVRDKFITELLSGKYRIVLDTENLLNRQKEK